MTTAPRVRRWPVLRLARVVAVGVIAGGVAGIVAAGGSRVVMRIVALLTDDALIGTKTENGNRVGEFTLEGTVGLIAFGGLFFGIAGGLVHTATRMWFERLRRPGLMWGLFAMVTLGRTVIDSGNEDFHRFGPPAAGVLLFAALFPLFGVVVEPVHRRLASWLPSVPPRRLRPVDILTFPLMILAAAAGTMMAAQGIVHPVLSLATGDVDLGTGLGLLALWVFVASPLLAARARRAHRTWPEAAIALGPPAAIGAALTAVSVAKIVG